MKSVKRGETLDLAEHGGLAVPQDYHACSNTGVPRASY